MSIDWFVVMTKFQKWTAAIVPVVGFWLFAGQLNLWRSLLVVGLSLASFTVGAAGGFLFTSYGEETGTVGKVKDWAVGAATGLTFAKFGAIKALLLTFAFGPGPNEFALTVSVCITFVGLGFYFMFLRRELILNVLLAEGRARRGRVEGTVQAGLATLRLLSAFTA
jgi:hypothetical protein